MRGTIATMPPAGRAWYAEVAGIGDEDRTVRRHRNAGGKTRGVARMPCARAAGDGSDDALRVDAAHRGVAVIRHQQGAGGIDREATGAAKLSRRGRPAVAAVAGLPYRRSS
jgi:hypothetical protein